MKISTKTLALTLLSSLVLTACAGGGGGSSDSKPTPTPVQPVTPGTPDDKKTDGDDDKKTDADNDKTDSLNEVVSKVFKSNKNNLKDGTGYFHIKSKEELQNILATLVKLQKEGYEVTNEDLKIIGIALNNGETVNYLGKDLTQIAKTSLTNDVIKVSFDKRQTEAKDILIDGQNAKSEIEYFGYLIKPMRYEATNATDVTKSDKLMIQDDKVIFKDGHPHNYQGSAQFAFFPDTINVDVVKQAGDRLFMVKDEDGNFKEYKYETSSGNPEIKEDSVPAILVSHKEVNSLEDFKNNIHKLPKTYAINMPVEMKIKDGVLRGNMKGNLNNIPFNMKFEPADLKWINNQIRAEAKITSADTEAVLRSVDGRYEAVLTGDHGERIVGQFEGTYINAVGEAINVSKPGTKTPFAGNFKASDSQSK